LHHGLLLKTLEGQTSGVSFLLIACRDAVILRIFQQEAVGVLDDVVVSWLLGLGLRLMLPSLLVVSNSIADEQVAAEEEKSPVSHSLMLSSVILVHHAQSIATNLMMQPWNRVEYVLS
jgi:hypothetical protein